VSSAVAVLLTEPVRVSGLGRVLSDGLSGWRSPLATHDLFDPTDQILEAIDQFGQVIDVLASEKRDLAAARRFFARALGHGRRPVEVTTVRAEAYSRVLDEQLSAAHLVDARYANNKIEADHGRLKARLRPRRGLKRLRAAQVVGFGHAFVQNLRRGHYELGTDAEPRHRLAAAFTELALTL
jgi:hypothetical protein